MRIAILVLMLAASGGAWAKFSFFNPPVNLDRPGVLEAMRQADPGRYEKVLRAVDALQSETCDEKLARFFKVQLDIRDLGCHYLLLTSDPPKMHVTFSVEDTPYEMNAVQYKLAEPRLFPAREAR